MASTVCGGRAWMTSMPAVVAAVVAAAADVTTRTRTHQPQHLLMQKALGAPLPPLPLGWPEGAAGWPRLSVVVAPAAGVTMHGPAPASGEQEVDVATDETPCYGQWQQQGQPLQSNIQDGRQANSLCAFGPVSLRYRYHSVMVSKCIQADQGRWAWLYPCVAYAC